MNDSDRDWEMFGANDPYWSVLTHDTYLKKNINNDAKEKFFRSGMAHIELIMSIIRDKLDPDFHPSKAIDFGCGVGRIIVPLSSICDNVLGIDISESMLKEAKNNCDERNIKNVNLMKIDDNFTNISEKYNFIHSFIVFQHIPCTRGENITKNLIDLLKDDGVGVLHYTFYKKMSKRTKIIRWLQVKAPFGDRIFNLLHRRKYNTPIMQMNNYNLNNLLLLLKERKCHNLYIRFSNHSEHLGATLFFQKRQLGYM